MNARPGSTAVCAVVGVGALGRGFVETLQRHGRRVLAYDVDREAQRWAAEAGAEPVAVAREAGAADVVLLAVPDTPQILEVCSGPDGLEAGLRPGATVLVMSTVDPETPRALAERFAVRGVSLLDAPVSGGPSAAREGSLSIMVGGDEETFARCRDVLEILGGHVVHVGPIGHGEIAKLANNLMGAVITLGIAEGLALAAKAGADVGRVCAAVAGGSGGSWILSNWLPATLDGDFGARFATSLMCKDMRLVTDVAARLGVAVPAVSLAAEQFDSLAAAGYGNSDFSVLVPLHAYRNGTAIASGIDQGGKEFGTAPAGATSRGGSQTNSNLSVRKGDGNGSVR